ncbi:unnamed protein product [Schistosoma mattheei]|uniref:Uncharacterized protein n=1 Tax=Schistosoma mattheei TaxID=31246 RepID=A0A3P8F7B2_9TREM|nr:unnamed protein product [Schistosoma mattheei]
MRIKDLERRIFLLPRTSSVSYLFLRPEDGELPTVKDVYMEFRDLTSQFKIGKFRCKTTEKRYAFEYADVPETSDYLEVRYAASYSALPADLQGKTFSHVFGTNTSFLENLVLDLQLRGPCWLEIKDACMSPFANPYSHTTASNPPYLSMMMLRYENLHTYSKGSPSMLWLAFSVLYSRILLFSVYFETYCCRGCRYTVCPQMHLLVYTG